MKKLSRQWVWHCAVVSLLLLATSLSSAAVRTGKAAPDFTLPGSDGESYTLSDYQGKKVILEWTNHGCPYVQKHYDSGNMQALQQEMTEQGIVWLSVISSRPNSQGYVEAEEANELTVSRKANPSAILLDPEGDVGRLYGAKTTPHMYIINEQGELVYQGAIDDKPSARPSSLKGAKNYVRAALADVSSGRPVKMAETTPYGCSVKY